MIFIFTNYLPVPTLARDCGGTYNGTSGNMTTPNYPERYSPGSECFYYINAPQATVIRLNFQTFDLEDGYDFFYYGRLGDTHNVDYSFTGEFAPEPVEFMASSLWFRFRSDGSVNNFGFSILWETAGKLILS